jgi:hypothetical protein
MNSGHRRDKLGTFGTNLVPNPHPNSGHSGHTPYRGCPMSRSEELSRDRLQPEPIA